MAERPAAFLALGIAFLLIAGSVISLLLGICATFFPYGDSGDGFFLITGGIVVLFAGFKWVAALMKRARARID